MDAQTFLQPADGGRPVGAHRDQVPWRQAQSAAPHPADYTPCAVCGGPYHPATGGLHYVSHSGREVPWCGPCELDAVKWLVAHIKSVRKRTTDMSGQRIYVNFYDHAFPPPER